MPDYCIIAEFFKCFAFGAGFAAVLFVLTYAILVLSIAWVHYPQGIIKAYREKRKAGKKEMNNKIKVVLDEGAMIPTRAHKNDAGLDIYSPEDRLVEAKSSATIDTGVHIQLPEGTVGMLKSKSGLNVKFGITSEGVIDSGYTGSITVKLYNNSGYDYKIRKGDKISQLVILPVLTPTPELSDSLEDTERGDNGFGSSGR